MPASKVKVNLLPPSEFEQSFWGRFLKWAVTTGRHIIILTELVVILAFLSRFKLDEDLRNLNEQITTQVSFLESLRSGQEEFLKVQKKLDLAGQMLTMRPKAGESLDYIEEKIPDGVELSKRVVTKNEISLTALTLSEQAMGKLLSTLSADQVWRSVDMTELVGNSTNGIKFSLSAKK
jgi:Tfp pilus assembly protein PilN